MKQIEKYLITTFWLFASTISAQAGDPACAGKDQGVCDTLGVMINARGKGCYKMMSVQPLGSNGYRITCIVSSSGSSRATYTLKLSSDQSSYTVN